MAGNWLIRRGQSKLLSLLLIASLILIGFAPVMMIQEPSYADGADEYVTVRIEAGGLGQDASGSALVTKTVLPQTKVSLSDLTTKTAIYAVNEALIQEGTSVAAEGDYSGFYTAFGGVYSGDTTYWNLYLNDKEASLGLDWTEINKGDSIILFLKDWMGNSPEYAYFAEDSTSYYNGEYLYATADLILQKNNPAVYDWTEPYDLISPESAEPLGDVDIIVTKEGAEVEQTKSDAENGTVSLSFFGEGTYEVTASKYENGKAIICPAYAEIKVTGSEIVVKTGSTALDTTLKTLGAVFKGDGVDAISTSTLSYLGGVMNIGNQYSKVDISAIANKETGTEEKDDDVSVSLSYKPESASNYIDKGEFDYNGVAKTVPLAEGENIIKLKVSNGLFDSYTHTLVVVRKPATDNSSATVNEIISGVKAVSGSPPSPDWILAMDAAGLKSEISHANKDLFLNKVLYDVRNYSSGGYVSTGTLAKYAMALTVLGIDARHIPDNEGNPINLIKLLAESKNAGDFDCAYEAPYILMLFSSGVYDLADYSEAKFSINDIVTAILGKQNNTNHLWPLDYPGIDETAMILPALAKYYNSDNTVKVAVDSAIETLSDNQGLEGGFDGGWGVNSNSASTVAAGLISLRINPHEDAGFIKNDVSLIDNLLGYKTPSNTLGYANNTQTNEMACIQGFGALASYRNLQNSSGRVNIYDVNETVHIYTNWPDAELLTGIAVTKEPTQKDYAYNASDKEVDTAGMEVTAYYNGDILNKKIIESGYTVSTIDKSTPGTKVVRVTYQGHEASFNVTVKDQSGATPQLHTVKITVRSSGKGVIASDSAYAVEPGKTTVQDVLKAVLTKANKSYTIIGGYVAEIDGLSEFDQGENSGWMYLVNGVDPVKAAGSYTLNGGETIEWKYTLDYTKESGANKWNPEQSKETAPAGKDDLNAALADIKAGRADSWTADTAKGSISFDKDALAGLIDEMGNNKLEVSIEETPAKSLTAEQKSAAGSRPVFDIKVTVGNNNIKSFGGKLIISIPYKLKEGELPTGIVVYHLNDKGELTPMEGHYDPVTGNVIFTVDHLSLYVIAYDETKAVWPFIDVKQSSDNWYYDAVKYTYEKGVFSGTSPNKFSPDVSLSRAMLAGALARISGADLAAYKESGFSDVDIKTWYGPSVAWAKEAGVVSGYKNKNGTFSFRPEDKISRQDIALMIHNFNEKVQRKAYDKVDAVKFKDKAEIQEYAKAAVQAMQEAGIISGFKDKDGNFDYRPAENTSRAQAASLVYNMLTK